MRPFLTMPALLYQDHPPESEQPEQTDNVMFRS